MRTPYDHIIGPAIAFAVIGLWLAATTLLLSVDPGAFPVWAVPPAMLVQTFLYTGLFITAHDAMHGTAAPAHAALNRAIGTTAVLLYALFDYRKLRAKHGEHHRHPASAHDPDYHDGRRPGFVAWYTHFLLGYVSWWQIAGMALVFNILHHAAGVPLASLLLFWVVPALCSTLQLFYFGTYLPHREPHGGYDNRHRARSNEYPPLLSFLTCYHFGYHYEHHEYPWVPWWRLPAVRQTTSPAAFRQPPVAP